MSAEPIPIMEKEPPPTPTVKKNLVQKLCEVMAAVGYTQKTGWNEAQKYHYVTEADIAEKIRPELAKRNVLILPSLISNERTKLERTKYDKQVTSYATDVVMRWTIVDGDSGEERVCDIPGCSESPGDKGVYVAITGSEKYLLMKTFLLPTGDDPESDSNEQPSSKEERKAKKFVEDEVERQKAGKTPRNAPARVTTLFYTTPERHNGHMAEFFNFNAFVASNLDKEQSLRFAFSAYGAKKSKDDTPLVPTEKLQGLLEKLVGDCGVDVHPLKAAE